MNDDTATCRLCGDIIAAGGLGAHFRLFHPDTGITEETVARAEIVDETED